MHIKFKTHVISGSAQYYAAISKDVKIVQKYYVFSFSRLLLRQRKPPQNSILSWAVGRVVKVELIVIPRAALYVLLLRRSRPNQTRAAAFPGTATSSYVQLCKAIPWPTATFFSPSSSSAQTKMMQCISPFVQALSWTRQKEHLCNLAVVSFSSAAASPRAPGWKGPNGLQHICTGSPGTDHQTEYVTKKN